MHLYLLLLLGIGGFSATSIMTWGIDASWKRLIGLQKRGSNIAVGYVVSIRVLYRQPDLDRWVAVKRNLNTSSSFFIALITGTEALTADRYWTFANLKYRSLVFHAHSFSLAPLGAAPEGKCHFLNLVTLLGTTRGFQENSIFKTSSYLLKCIFQLFIYSEICNMFNDACYGKKFSKKRWV